METTEVAGGSTRAIGTEERELVDPQELWERTGVGLRAELGGNFTAWFGRARPVSVDGESFVLAVPSQFVKEWIEGRYVDQLRDAVVRAAARDLAVVLITDVSLDGEGGTESPSPSAHEPDETHIPELVEMPADFHPKYTFESFVIGESNRFAHAAALAVAEAPAESYNPLFIYGGAGLGKTHLLHAIGRYVRDWKPGSVVRYVTTEQFLNDFIVSLKRRSIPDFHRRYRAADLLLVDDVQFLENKEGIQEEFFHTFNALHPRSQIVLSSDRPPKKIATLEERLRTRFEWGLITDIQPPDLETRVAILRKKTETERLSMPDDVLDYIANRIQTNIRELEGALIRVAAYASLTRSEITLDRAQQVLQSLLPNNNETRITSDLVMSVAASYFDVSVADICSPSRSRPLVNARQIAMYLCRELTDLSLPEIGKRFGGRDHSTVIFAVNKVKQHMKERETWFEQVRELTTRIRQQAARA